MAGYVELTQPHEDVSIELESVIVEIATKTKPQVLKPDLEDNQKRWLVVGICLHSVLSPALRQYVALNMTKMYKTLKKSYKIDMQIYPNVLQKYPVARNLNYEAVNNNRSVLFRGKNDLPNYDYKIQNPVDLSKLFLNTQMTQYTGFDETCDSEMKYTVLALVCIVVVNGYSFKRTEKSKYLGNREKFVLKHGGIEMAKEEFGEKGKEEAEEKCLEKPDEKIGECILDEGKRLCEEGEDDQCKRIEYHIMFTIVVGKHLLESGCLAKEVEDADIGPCLQEDVYDDMKEYEHLFDTRDFPKQHFLHSDHKKGLCKFKDESNGEAISEFVGLRSKMYSYTYEGGEKHTVKDQHSPVPYSYEDGPGEQTYENMPSCDDCGVVLDSMHDLQRHIKHWCPENEYLKRKRDNEDLGNESPSKKSASEWIKYDSVSDDSSEDVNMDDNEGYKSLLHEAIDTAKDTWDKKKYDKYVKEDYETQIRRILMKNRHQFDELFDDDYFEMNTDTEDKDDEDDEKDTDEDIQEED
ncbi:Hypothetical predicted protein [Mytilus galloprovincialis]|uniref:Uncharacterized protein n=1 Tax=Mytilus galloprovincialis TaxID=29158 RepID=A0A8B6BYY3_MYTGA|nr:Hypothetical predicted protein [Mytilus galloprovincialis]